MRISQWLPLPVPSCRCRGRSRSPRRAGRPGRRSCAPAAGRRPRRCRRSGSRSSRRFAPEMNHLWPLITQSSPSFTAFVWISVGSEPATSGSVIAKHERARPSASGRRYRSFCSGVAQCSSVCMLPSSGACALMTNGPMPVRPASADTNAIAIGAETHAVPLRRAGAGSRGPDALRLLAQADDGARRSSLRSAPFARASASAGRTSSSMNLRTR